MEFLGRILEELSRRQVLPADAYGRTVGRTNERTDKQTDRQTEPTTIPLRQNLPRGKNGPIILEQKVNVTHLLWVESNARCILGANLLNP